jgi:hypothetical protein
VEADAHLRPGRTVSTDPLGFAGPGVARVPLWQGRGQGLGPQNR